MQNGLIAIGGKAVLFFREVGQVARLFFRIVYYLKSIARVRTEIVRELYETGVRSLPLVLFVGIFAGAVASVQTLHQMKDYVSPYFLGAATSVAIFVEMGPVLTALVLAGRMGASIAAELATMHVTEQIDALEVLAVDPVHYLALPRVLAGFIMLPVLTVFTDVIALFGAFAVAFFQMDLSAGVFFGSVKDFFSLANVLSGLIKAFFFGGITALIGCHIGLRAGGGARGVGLATIRAFVLSSALILLNDYLISTLIF
jgi:phospholipid/cholesterol/gamma-HCH transport system permease protein